MAEKQEREKILYGIIAPEEIPEDLFERLNDSPGKFIREKLRKSLENLPGLGVTSSTTPKGALSNFFFRESERGLYEKVTARSFNKMFSPEADRYVFQIPLYDRSDKDGKSLTNYQANMMRAADLDSEISEKRNEKSSSYISAAIDLIKLASNRKIE